MASERLPAWLDLLDGELAPIRGLAARLCGDGFTVDAASGSLLISPTPVFGTEAFACNLFPGLARDVISRYQDLQLSAVGYSLAIPELYRQVLQRLNGAYLFGVSLYGLPPTTCQSPPLLNRSSRQPLDLASAQQDWRGEYNAKQNRFHFGSGPRTYQENVGYFLNEDKSVEAFVEGGELAWKWSSISEFLLHELARAESLFYSPLG